MNGSRLRRLWISIHDRRRHQQPSTLYVRDESESRTVPETYEFPSTTTMWTAIDELCLATARTTGGAFRSATMRTIGDEFRRMMMMMTTGTGAEGLHAATIGTIVDEFYPTAIKTIVDKFYPAAIKTIVVRRILFPWMITRTDGVPYDSAAERTSMVHRRVTFVL